MSDTRSHDLASKDTFRIRLDGDPIPDINTPSNALLGINFHGTFKDSLLLTTGDLVFLGSNGLEKHPTGAVTRDIGENPDKLGLANITRTAIVEKLATWFDLDQLDQSVVIDWIDTPEVK